MADAYTEFLNMTKPEVGASRDTWGNKYNDNFGKVDAWAKATDAAVKSAAAVAAAALPKTGGNLSGDIAIGKEYPNIYMNYTNGAQWLMSVREWGGFVFFAANRDVFGIGTDGSVYTRQIGDLKNAIDAAAAKGTEALAKAVAKTGDQMTGALGIYGNFAQYRFGRADKSYSVGWLLHTDNRAYLQRYDANLNYVSNLMHVGPDGDVVFGQMGDLSTYINNVATNNQNAAVNRSVTAMRMPFAGDLYNSWNLNGGMAEPYAGSLISSRATVADGTANGAWIPGIFRWRYNQFYIPNQGWITSYYA